MIRVSRTQVVTMDFSVPCPRCDQRMTVQTQHQKECTLVRVHCGNCGHLRMGSNTIRDVAYQLATTLMGDTICQG
jgi:transcription elongation factor Elf1